MTATLPCPICRRPIGKWEAGYVRDAPRDPFLRVDLTCENCGVFRSDDRKTCHLYVDRRAVKSPVPDSFCLPLA
jgi:hypothetical protein